MGMETEVGDVIRVGLEVSVEEGNKREEGAC